MLRLAAMHANTAWVARRGVREELGWPLFNTDNDGSAVTGKFLQVEAVLCAPSYLHVITQRGQSLEDMQGGCAAQ